MAGVNGHLFRLATFAGLYGERSYAQTAQPWQAVRLADEEAVRRHMEGHRPRGAPRFTTR